MWTHPCTLTMEHKESEDKDEDDDEETLSGVSPNMERMKASGSSRWYGDLLNNACESDINLSGKLVVFREILDKCRSIGDKLYVFFAFS